MLNQDNNDYIDNKFKEILDNVKNVFDETNSDKINEEFRFPLEIKIETLNTYFDLLFQSNLLDKFSIGIDNNIYSENLQDKYKLFFNKINELNINYPPIKIKCENELSNILKDINIDLLKIKIARVITDKPYNYYYFNNYLNFPPTSNEFSISFMKIICSFSNLIYLDFAPEVDNPYYLYNPNKTNNDKRILTNESFDLINNLNNLKYLKVYSIDVNKKGILNLNNIISLNIAFSSNISFTQNFCNNIKEIDFDTYEIIPEIPFKFPNLEKMKISNSKINPNSYIDFSSLKKLKIFEGNGNDIIYLNDDIPVENIIMQLYAQLKNNELNNIFQKLSSLKSLKILKMDTNFKIFEEIKKIKIKNFSINQMTLNMSETDFSKEIKINNFLENFPNLSNFSLGLWGNYYHNKTSINNIKIEENKNCNIGKIYLTVRLPESFIELFCCPFENLQEISLNIDYKYELTNILPIFNNECKVIFKSLIKFEFVYNDYIKSEELLNLYNNINIMPNLKYINISLISDMNREFYIKIISKLLSLNLKSISFQAKKSIFEYINPRNIYSEKELKEIKSDINFNNYNKIEIIKHFSDVNIKDDQYIDLLTKCLLNKN